MWFSWGVLLNSGIGEGGCSSITHFLSSITHFLSSITHFLSTVLLTLLTPVSRSLTCLCVCRSSQEFLSEDSGYGVGRFCYDHRSFVYCQPGSLPCVGPAWGAHHWHQRPQGETRWLAESSETGRWWSYRRKHWADWILFWRSSSCHFVHCIFLLCDFLLCLLPRWFLFPLSLISLHTCLVFIN